MTRVKQNLIIHLNGNYLDHIIAENIQQIEDIETYLPTNEMVVHLTYKDIWLHYFIKRQHLVSEYMSGDVLTLKEDECLNSKG